MDPTDEDASSLRKTRVKLGEGIAGEVGRTGALTNMSDAHRDKMFNPAVDRSIGGHTSSVLCCALKDSLGKVIGVLEAFNKQDGKAFTEQDEHNLVGFSVVAGATIEINLMRAERARMTKQIEHLLSLAAYMKMNDDPDTDHLYQFLIDRGAEMAHASKGSLYLYAATDSHDEVNSRVSLRKVAATHKSLLQAPTLQ